jgi:hypothetical protein
MVASQEIQMKSKHGVTILMLMPNAAEAIKLVLVGKEMPPFARDLAMAISPALLLEKEPSSEKVLVSRSLRASQLVKMQPLAFPLEARLVMEPMPADQLVSLKLLPFSLEARLVMEPMRAMELALKKAHPFSLEAMLVMETKRALEMMTVDMETLKAPSSVAIPKTHAPPSSPIIVTGR